MHAARSNIHGPRRFVYLPAISGLSVLLLISTAFPETHYVATDGVDTNPGTIDDPFATITRKLLSHASSAAGIFSRTAFITRVIATGSTATRNAR